MDFIFLSKVSLLVFMTATLLTYSVRYFALKNKILDIPNQRSSHQQPIPRGGGLAIVFTFNFALLLLWHKFHLNALFAALTIGGIIIAAVGYYDDLFHMNPRSRSIIQFITATFAILLINGLPVLNFGTWQFDLHFMGTIIGIISIVWLTNLYNFMDGIDGLAGSEGLFVSITAGILLWSLGTPQHAIAGLFFLLAASIAGFTVFNWPPAKIFLGDVGSGFLGFNLAILGIYCAKHTTLSISFWLILLAVFICDATFTVIRRGWQKKPWYAAHREHAYQRVVIAGATHRQTTCAVLGINCLFILPFALLSMRFPQTSGWFMLFIVFCLFILWSVITHRLRTLST